MAKIEMQTPRTTNPAGNTVYTIFSIQPPAQSVLSKQDPEHTEDDFLHDLEKVTQRQPKPS
jgi:hypothetical protein